MAIKYTDEGQDPTVLQKVASDMGTLLTHDEEIHYIALQNKTALTLKKDSVVATTKRVIFYRP